MPISKRFVNNRAIGQDLKDEFGKIIDNLNQTTSLDVNLANTGFRMKGYRITTPLTLNVNSPATPADVVDISSTVGVGEGSSMIFFDNITNSIGSPGTDNKQGFRVLNSNWTANAKFIIRTINTSGATYGEIGQSLCAYGYTTGDLAVWLRAHEGFINVVPAGTKWGILILAFNYD